MGRARTIPTAWVYRRAGLPLEVIKEFEGWRQVRDADGAAGWVLQSFPRPPANSIGAALGHQAGGTGPQVALRRDDSEQRRAPSP